MLEYKFIGFVNTYRLTYNFASVYGILGKKTTQKHSVSKEERYSRVPRLSETRYSAKGSKGK